MRIVTMKAGNVTKKWKKMNKGISTVLSGPHLYSAFIQSALQW